MKGKFSKDVRADKDALHMSCPEVVGAYISVQLAQYIRFKRVAELCCAVGLLSVQLAKVMDKVYAVDLNSDRIRHARYNARLYGVEDRIEFIVGDVLDEDLLKSIRADVAVLDPDWRADPKNTALAGSVDDTHPSLRKMFSLTQKHIAKDIVTRIPKDWTFKTLESLGACRIDNIHWQDRLRFRIAFFLQEIDRCHQKSWHFR
ncbi:methyltransferase domain-containing protein [Candidatus Woesearchaeota archaeon]|nr:methyltransferase domain-containing protein [Candidatus Woesearchaeota archaeon]